MKINLVVLLLQHALPIFGACPSPNSSCTINKTGYKRMCSCNSNAPSQCNLQKNCVSCTLQRKTCTPNSDAQPCCPIRNGNSFCNSETKKCEAMRFCREDGTGCPFDELSPVEIDRVIGIIQNSSLFSVYTDYPIIRTLEPSKSKWNSANRSTSKHRIAYAAVFDWSNNRLYKVLVDLRKGSVISKSELKSKLPPIMSREYDQAKKVFIVDPRVKRALARRGLNVSLIVYDMSPVGLTGPRLNLPGKRLLRISMIYQDPRTPYFDWAYIEGIEATVDLNSMKMESFSDTGEMPPFPPPSNISYDVLGDKPQLQPLVITQVEGSSIRVKGQQLQWYKWKFMFGMDPIHGLQLYHVRYQGDCQDRLVLYKISLSEMFVPYGALGKHWRWRGFFDAGEYSLGSYVVPLIPGQDVPENAVRLNCTQFASGYVGPGIIPGCIVAFERDTGTLYKHSEGKDTIGRRGREMVLSSLSIVANYGYIFEYIFHMDGVLRVNVKLVGTPLPRSVAITRNDPNCIESCITLVEDNVVAPQHQHWFNFRMDLDVDGPINHALQVDVTNDPVGPQNLDGGAFSPKKKIIKTETAQDFDIGKSRTWHVVNAQSRNRFGSPRGYAIKPGDVTYSYFKPTNPYYPQSEFVAHPFWVTSYKDKEQSGASDFPRTGKAYQGLPEYVKDRQSVENRDLVTWYTVGLTHVTRPEEWPLMNVHSTSFSLVPYNFQSQNSEVPLEGRCP